MEYIKFTCNKEELELVLQNTIKIVNTNAQLESLRGILIKNKNGQTEIKATNLEINLTTSITTIDTQDGEILVNPKILLDIIKYTQSKKVTIEQNESNIKITTDTTKTIIKSLNKGDFPNFHNENSNKKEKIKIKKIISGIKSVLFATSHSIIKPELSSVYLWTNKDEIIFVATDSFRLAEKRVKYKTNTNNDFNLLIPYKNTQIILNILELLDEEDYINFSFESGQIVFTTDKLQITSRVIDGVFPDYQKIIPKEPVTEVTVLRKDLWQTIKKTVIFVDKFNKIYLSVDKKEKNIKIQTKNGENGEMMDLVTGVIEGDNVEITLNNKYLNECLQNIDDDSVIISFFGEGQPIIIRSVNDKTFLYLVMPMNG